MIEYKINQGIWNIAQIFNSEADFRYPPEQPKIEVDKIVSKLAFAYEKLRYAVDYREEHLIRRHAIERIIKRNNLWKINHVKSSLLLIEELIRAGYLKNNYVPETKIVEVAKALERYTELALSRNGFDQEKPKKINNWLWSICSVEIEYILISHVPQLRLLENFYLNLRQSLLIRQSIISEREQKIQIFIAAHKSLLKSDIATISYQLLLMYVPRWNSLGQSQLEQLAVNLDSIKKQIEGDLRHPLADQLVRVIKPRAVYYSVINDLFFQFPNKLNEILFNPKRLEEKIQEICQGKYKITKQKLRRSTINSIVYIFLTKIILAFVIEVPYDFLVLGYINYLPLLANVFFHPLLMLTITTSTKVPGDENTKKIITEVKNIIYNIPSDKLLHQFKKSVAYGTLRFAVTGIFYLMLYFITFGLIIWALSNLGFNFASGCLFVFFLTLICFFGIRIRHSVRESLVLKKGENFISFFFDLLTLPLIRVGRFISVNSSRVNIFIFFFDYIIETPFKLLIKSIETGIFYIKEKKEEIFS